MPMESDLKEIFTEVGVPEDVIIAIEEEVLTISAFAKAAPNDEQVNPTSAYITPATTSGDLTGVNKF